MPCVFLSYVHLFNLIYDPRYLYSKWYEILRWRGTSALSPLFLPPNSTLGLDEIKRISEIPRGQCSPAIRFVLLSGWPVSLVGWLAARIASSSNSLRILLELIIGTTGAHKQLEQRDHCSQLTISTARRATLRSFATDDPTTQPQFKPASSLFPRCIRDPWFSRYYRYLVLLDLILMRIYRVFFHTRMRFFIFRFFFFLLLSFVW